MAWVCGHLLAGIVGLNPLLLNGYVPFVSAVSCQVKVSSLGWSLAQRNPTVCVCGVSECDREVSIMRRP